MKKLNFFYLLVCLTLFATSCRDTTVNTPEVDPEIKLQVSPEFKKQITIKDELGTSSIVMEIASNDESKVAEYDEDAFILVPLFEKPEDAEENDAEINEKTTEYTEPDKNAVHYTVIEENLIDGAVGYELQENENARYIGHGRRWIHGYYTGRGIKIKDTYGCTSGNYYYASNGWYYYNGWFQVCNGYSFYYRRYNKAVGVYITSSGYYNYYFYW